MPTYVNIPVDEDTNAMLVELCEAYDLGKRAKGTMVRKLARAEFAKLMDAKLLLSQQKKARRVTANTTNPIVE